MGIHVSRYSARASGTQPWIELPFIRLSTTSHHLHLTNSFFRVIRDALGLPSSTDGKIESSDPRALRAFSQSIILEAEMVAFSEVFDRIDGELRSERKTALITLEF